MKHLTKTILAFLYACSFIMAGSTVCYASQHPLPYETAAGNVPLAVNSTVVTNVESHTAKYHIFSEKINMTAHVGELWQAQGDVLYQTNDHDVTDLAKGEDGRYAVKFTNPGEAIIRVYYRKNGEVYVQDFLFTIKPQSEILMLRTGQVITVLLAPVGHLTGGTVRKLRLQRMTSHLPGVFMLKGTEE